MKKMKLRRATTRFGNCLLDGNDGLPWTSERLSQKKGNVNSIRRILPTWSENQTGQRNSHISVKSDRNWSREKLNETKQSGHNFTKRLNQNKTRLHYPTCQANAQTNSNNAAQSKQAHREHE
jgi:hypothetical protein